MSVCQCNWHSSWFMFKTSPVWMLCCLNNIYQQEATQIPQMILLVWNFIQQESPPAWTQEAYRPLCSKYSLCCPNWVPPPGGQVRVPPPGGGQVRVPPRGGSGPGTPPGGGGCQVRVPPQGGWGLGTSPRGGCQVQVPPGGVRSRYPPGGVRSGYPGGVRSRYPPGGSGPGTPPYQGSGYPPPSQVPPLWTDKHLWKQYLPVVLRTRAVKMLLSIVWT